MTPQQYYIAYMTIVRREVSRFMRVWIQTLLPPAITMTLYFVVFGSLIGPRIGEMDGYPYIQFIVPGLIMMSVIQNSYGNVVSSFYSIKFMKNIEELLISPTPNIIILLGFITGGVLRGLLVGCIVSVIALMFTHLTIHHGLVVIAIVLLSATLFSLAGFINAIYARKFDDISIIPTFVLAPLTYLGGVFYSIHLLPEFWHKVSLVNPILYMVNGFRYGILGITDINLGTAFAIICLFVVLLFWFCLYLLEAGIGLRQ